MATHTQPSREMERAQGLMVFLGAVTDGLESLVGKGSQAICFRAGRAIGLKHAVQRKEKDLDKALELVRQEMLVMGIDWPFRSYKKEGAASHIQKTEDGFIEISMPFGNCMVRCTLFRYGFPQEMSLCQTKHGLFCGLFEAIYGVQATLGIDHSGENACLLRLRFRDKPLEP